MRPVTRPRAMALRALAPTALLLGALGACGTGSGSDVDPDVGSDRLTGTWVIELAELRPPVGSDDEELMRIVIGEIDEIVFDQTAASIEATTGCRRIFGAYTFIVAGSAAQDPRKGSGIASFTVPGLSTNDCPAEEDLAAASLTSLLEQVQSWRQEADRLVFEGPEGRLRLRPVG